MTKPDAGSSVKRAKVHVAIAITPLDRHGHNRFPIAEIKAAVRAALDKYCSDRSAEPLAGEKVGDALYTAPAKDVPLGARVRYPGSVNTYILIARHGNGVIAQWCEDMPRGWFLQGIYSISDGPCADVEMEVLRG